MRTQIRNNISIASDEMDGRRGTQGDCRETQPNHGGGVKAEVAGDRGGPHGREAKRRPSSREGRCWKSSTRGGSAAERRVRQNLRKKKVTVLIVGVKVVRANTGRGA